MDMDRVVGVRESWSSTGEATGSGAVPGRRAEQAQSGELTERIAQSKPDSEQEGGLPDAVVGLQPLVELAAAAASETDIDKLLRRAAEIAAGALSLRHLLIFAADWATDTLPTYAGVGWSAKEQRRVVRRLEKEAVGPVLPRQACSSTARARQTEADTFFESGPLELQGFKGSLLVVRGGGLSPVGILADCREVPAARKAQATGLFRALAAVLGLALARASKHHEVSALDAQVRRAKIQWEDAVDVLHQLVCVLDHSGRVVRANRTLEAWGLGSVKSAPGKTMHELLHPQCGDACCALRQACSRAWQEMGDRGLSRFDVGDPVLGRELRVGLVPNRKERGALESGGFGFVIIEDVTERKTARQMLEHFNQELQRRVAKKTEELNRVNQELRGIIEEHCRDRRALEESQQKYTSFVENTLTGIYLLECGRITFCNSRFAALLGYAREELTGKQITEVLLPVTSSMRAELAGTGWGEGGSDEVAPEQLCRGLTKSGWQIWLKTSRAQILAHGESLIVGNVVDVTEQIEAETVLIRSERELRDLSERLINAQEEERQRIAGELHDGIGQQLSVIKFGVERVLGDARGKLPSHQERELGAIVARVRETIEEVRRVSMDLRPSILDDLGLVSTIDWFCREFQQMEPTLAIHKSVKIQEGDIPGELKVAIFRILQEACNNVSKYAKATLVGIKLGKQDGTIRFCVSDDGTGFDYQRLSSRGKGFGLGSMKQRAKLTGGVFRLWSARGLGTRIEVEWPPDLGSLPD